MRGLPLPPRLPHHSRGALPMTGRCINLPTTQGRIQKARLRVG